MPRPVETVPKPPELPPRLAKLVLEREPLPTPKKAPEPPRVAKAELPPEALPPKADPRPAPKRERTKEAPVPEARVPQPNKPPGEIERRAAQGCRRRPAGDEGQLAEMRGAPVAVQLKTRHQARAVASAPASGVGVGAGNEARPVRHAR